jgi:hypothetical protein
MKKLATLGLVLLIVMVLVNQSEAYPRKVVVEIFTSTTCSPCFAADDFYFNNWLPNYGGNAQIITVAYHVWWPSPGNDPMYLANPTPVQTRNTYYQGSSAYAPRGFIDGFIDGTSAYSTWPGAIEPRFLDPSPISIVLTGTRNGNTLNMNAQINASMPVNSSNWRVHWLVLQDGIPEPQNSPSGYVPFTHHAVHRTMLPDGNGSTISISQGQTVDIPRTITLGSGWTANNCKVVVIVQNNTDKKIQQAEVIEVQTLTDVPGGTGTIPTSFSLEQNYPNPFNPTTTIQYNVSERSFVSLKVFNMLGEEVKTLVAAEQAAGSYPVVWNATDNAGRDVPSGVYFYQMTAGNFKETRKLMLLK